MKAVNQLQRDVDLYTQECALHSCLIRTHPLVKNAQAITPRLNRYLAAPKGWGTCTDWICADNLIQKRIIPSLVWSVQKPYRYLIYDLFPRKSKRLRVCRHHIHWRGGFRIHSLVMSRNIRSHQNNKPIMKLHLKSLAYSISKRLKKLKTNNVVWYRIESICNIKQLDIEPDIMGVGRWKTDLPIFGMIGFNEVYMKNTNGYSSVFKSPCGIVFHNFDLVTPCRVSTVKSIWDLRNCQSFSV